MRNILRIFFTTEATRPSLVLLCLVLAGFAEGLGVSALLPAIAAIAGEAPSGFNQSISQAFRFAGLEPSVGALIFVMAALLTLKCLLAFIAMSYAGMAVANVAVNLRRKLFNALFAARWSFFSGQHVGRFANAMSNDATRAADAYYLSAMFLSYTVQAITYGVVGLLIDWRLFSVGLILGLIIAATLGRIIRISRRAGLKQTNRTAEMTVFVTDVISNLKPLKTMDRYGPMRGLMERILAKLRSALLTHQMAKQGIVQGGDAMTAIVLGTGVYIAAVIWKVPLHEMVVMGIVFFQAIAIVSRLQKYLQASVLHESAYENIEKVVAEARAEAENHTGTRAPRFERSIRAENVSFAHEDTPVIRDATLEIEAGSITVLQGPSGAGKTTLIDVIAGLHLPDSGRILVDGVPLADLDMKRWRALLGYVPQELNLLHGTVRENIALGDPALDDKAIMDAIDQAGAASFIAALPAGLDTDVGEMGGKLSGGQRQRISLARALVTQPKLLILDEVTSALDPATEAEICRNIAGLAGRYTIVAITHRPAWTRIATRLYKVEAGLVTEAMVAA